MAKNLWATYKDPIARWTADLSPSRQAPDRLLRFLLTVLAAGEETAAYVVQEAPLALYRRERDGQLGDVLAARYAETGVVDLFHFASSRRRRLPDGEFRVAARIAYFDPQGNPCETQSEDFGALLEQLRPADVAVAAGLMAPCEPVDIRGARVDFRDPGQSAGKVRPDSVWLDFQIASDIWLPWVDGILDEDHVHGRPADNRALAQRHTPRLNRFLATAREAALATGGSWSLDDESVRRDRLPMIGDDGIRLDAAPADAFAAPR